jgi:hypothetical protein
MPARNERLYLVPRAPGAPVRVVELPIWWDRRGFFQHFGPRAVDTGSPFREESGILLTAGEAITLDEQGRAAFAGDPRRAVLEQAMTDLHEALREAAWVVVESFEWESGLV